MTRPLALLRPEPGWSASAAAARAAGLEIVGHPLFSAEAVDWVLPSSRFHGLVAGSAAVFRHGGPQLEALSHLPVHAVGEATAEAARSAGFHVARSGSDGLQALLDASAGEQAHYLRLGGEERVALTPHPGQVMTEIAVYRLVTRSIEPDFAATLASQSPVVALHSAAAARHFALEVDRLGISRGTQFLIALGPRIAKDAGLGWAALHLADSPSDSALLAKAAALCK